MPSLNSSSSSTAVTGFSSKMDRINKFFIKPWNSTAMFSQDPLPLFVWEHLLMRITLVYCTLFYTSVFVLCGAFFHLFYDLGGLITALGCIEILWEISRINPWREFPRVILLMAAAFLFGATIGPLINLITEIDQRVVIKIIMGVVVFFSCHCGAILNSLKRNVIYQLGNFCAPIFVTAWMVISETYPGLLTHATFLVLLPLSWYIVVFLRKFFRNTFCMTYSQSLHLPWCAFLFYSFEYPVLDLVCAYLIVLGFLIHMKMHSQEAIFMATHEESYYVNTTITFYTEFIARTISLLIQIVRFIRGKLRGIRWLRDRDHDHE